MASAIERKTGMGVVANPREPPSFGAALGGEFARGAAAGIQQERMRGQIRAGPQADVAIFDANMLDGA